jgi:4-hydroxy-tetrahydrodipicolinate reductase
MKIALLGYGKMGKEIEKIALERGHSVPLIIDINNKHDLTVQNLKKADVAIDFSIPESAFENILQCFEAGIPIVSGTTGWLDKFNVVTKICRDKNQTFFYASNYSLGVNLFFNLNRYLAKMMNSFENYNVAMTEIHHTQKLDAPSGTAISLANDIISALERKKNWELTNKPSSDVLGITAVREGTVPGTHIITYDSDIDYIKIEHVAKGRKGFAFGAVLAAEFIKDKKGLFSMEDLLKL